MTAENLAGLLAAGLCMVAGWTDYTAGRIPNPLTYGGMVLAFTLALLVPDIDAGQRLLAVAMAFAILFLFWHRGLIGGGDVKLTMMVGAFKGATFSLYFLLYTFSFALVVILFLAVLRCGLWATITFLLSSLFGILMFRPTPTAPKELEGLTVPFGALGFAAIILCLVLERQGLLTPPIQIG